MEEHDVQNAEPTPASTSDVPDSTPIYAETVASTTAPNDESSEEVPETSEPHDEEDVPEMLKRETHDGPGFSDESELPDEDFDSFAKDDVEVDA